MHPLSLLLEDRREQPDVQYCQYLQHEHQCSDTDRYLERGLPTTQRGYDFNAYRYLLSWEVRGLSWHWRCWKGGGWFGGLQRQIFRDAILRWNHCHCGGKWETEIQKLSLYTCQNHHKSQIMHNWFRKRTIDHRQAAIWASATTHTVCWFISIVLICDSSTLSLTLYVVC